MHSSLSLPVSPTESPAVLVTDEQEARALWAEFRHHSRSFSFAARLLPRRLQLPIATLYLYCRTVDTIADERVREIGAKRAIEEVHTIRHHLKATLAGEPPNDRLWQRLAWVHERYGLHEGALFELTDGALWDLEGRTVETEDDLITYSNYVGGCVGVMMLPFLIQDPAQRRRLETPARSLGIAMQITNITRDVGEDIRLLDRLYVPVTWMQHHGISPDALRQPAPPHTYAALMEQMMQTAERYYDQSMQGIDALPWRMRIGILSAARVYREILNEVRAKGYNNLTHRAFVPFERKVLRVLRDSYPRRRAKLLANVNDLS